MNHQIENDVDIKRAGCEDAEPVNLEEHGLGNERGGGANRWIKSFQMADLADPAQTLGKADQFIGVCQRRGQRFFDQDINTGFHQSASGFQVADRGHSHRCSLDFAVCGSELLDGTEGATSEFPGGGVGSGQVRIDDPHQADRFALLCQLVIDAGVVASEGANADYGYVNDVVSSQVRALGKTDADLITNGFMPPGTS
jgi:hypothetical protein